MLLRDNKQISLSKFLKLSFIVNETAIDLPRIYWEYHLLVPVEILEEVVVAGCCVAALVSSEDVVLAVLAVEDAYSCESFAVLSPELSFAVDAEPVE